VPKQSLILRQGCEWWIEVQTRRQHDARGRFDLHIEELISKLSTDSP